MQLPMKHTIKGKHGHMFSSSINESHSPGQLFNKKSMCVSASKIADVEYLVGTIRLREKLSLKWDVCMGCWAPGPKNGLYGYRKGAEVLLGKECDKCASGYDAPRKSRKK